MLYSFAIYIYSILVRLAAFFNPKARLLARGQRDTFRLLHERLVPGGRYVWFHAASLGEFEQGRPLMERIRREHPELRILLTFFSPSGYEVRKDYDGADIVCYLPFDTPSNVIRFVRLVKPEMLFLIKYEFWFNYIIACRHRHIPVYSVSSIFRANKVFFRWYGRPYAYVLKLVTHFYVQDEESARLLATRGIRDKVSVVGDTRFDRVLDIRRAAKELPLVERFAAGRFVLVAGSSWGPDEDLIIPYFNAHPELRLILAPHLIDDDHLQQIEQKLQRPSLRYTEATEQNIDTAECLIINCFGLLSSIYRYGQLAYVGGGFGAGIHNVPEAAVYGIPVLFGPNNKGFREAQALLRMGACHEVTDEVSFVETMDRLCTDETDRVRCGKLAGGYIADNAGAADKIYTDLF
ncbi:MAG: 3-deoxy-D-manno-octulosonic acid transferase [Bacteroidaceae bacterium]|nr:3-deoxy-D-manno-octulosonic acid transferase [Bacteroidaceae bacterium]